MSNRNYKLAILSTLMVLALIEVFRAIVKGTSITPLAS